ncbi:hypothetical protein ACJX0J_007763, partial [Zea mays]
DKITDLLNFAACKMAEDISECHGTCPGLKSFDELILNWPKEAQGIQYMWNQYLAEKLVLNNLQEAQMALIDDTIGSVPADSSLINSMLMACRYIGDHGGVQVYDMAYGHWGIYHTFGLDGLETDFGFTLAVSVIIFLQSFSFFYNYHGLP